MRARGLALFGLLPLLAAASFGQGLPDGPDLQVNTTTQESQREADVAMLPGGEFLVVWSSDDTVGPDIHGPSIRVRGFDAGGTPAGDDLQLNTYTLFDQSRPSVASAGDGFVVVYESGISRIAGREVDSGGAPAGDEYFVHQDPGGSALYQAAVASAPDGRRVVVWDDPGGIGVRLYGADGVPAGAAFLADPTPEEQWAPDVGVADDGGFIVVWTAFPTPPDAYFEVRGRRFDSDGVPLGPVFAVNALTTGVQARPAIAVGAAGEFVVAWGSDVSAGSDDSASSIQARRFDADGAPLGPELQVNVQTTSFQNAPDVAHDPAGGFFVAWSNNAPPGGGGSGTTVAARRFGAEGLPYSGEFQLNSLGQGLQNEVQIAVGADGSLRAVWTSDVSAGDDTSRSSIQTRRFRPPLFADGFELGDATRWTECPGAAGCEP